MPIEEAQLTNKQHAVPQNIMDVEFKVMGDLTMRQFLYLMVFGGTAYGVFTLMESQAKWIIILVLGLTGLALAFVPIQDRGLDQWIVNFFSAIYKPTQRVWKKDPVIPTAFTYQNMAMVKKELITLAPTSSRRKLEEYLETTEITVEKDPLDIDEAAYIKKVQEAFEYESTQIPADYAMQAPTTTVTLKEPEVEEPEEDQAQEQRGAKQEIEEEQRQKEKKEPATAEQKPEKEQKKEEKKSRFKLRRGKDKEQQTSADQEVQKPEPKPQPKPQPKQKARLPKQSRVPLSPMTPDRHTGRVFTSFLPSSGDLILPVKGEKVLKTSAEVQIEEDLGKKAEQLKDLLQQIKSDEKYRDVIEKADMKTQPKAPEKQPNILNYQTDLEKPTEKEINEQAEKVAQNLKEENVKLTREIEELKKQVQKQENPQKKEQTLNEIRELQKEKESATEDYQKVRSHLSDLQEKIKARFSGDSEDYQNQQAVPKAIKTKGKDSTPSAGTANIISGVVKDQNDKPLEGVIVIIKNQKNEPIVGIKTNVVGQFYITTPVTNGSYTVEVDKSEKTGLDFDIINVEAKGQVIPPLEFIGKPK